MDSMRSGSPALTGVPDELLGWVPGDGPTWADQVGPGANDFRASSCGVTVVGA